MNLSARGLPEFARPPINEVVLGVQCAPIEGLTASHLGLFWNDVRSEFPGTEEKSPLEPVVERFGEKPVVMPPQFRILDKPETPRVWFLNEAGNQLVQLQRDRLIHNWRKREESEQYPRYDALRSAFKAELERFAAFIARERIGDFRPAQCEITYINQIMPCEVWHEHHELEKVFATWKAPAREFLPAPEDGQFAIRFIIRDEQKAPLGRLYVQVVPASLKKDDSLVLKMDLTARGRPESDSIDGVLRFLDRGHEWIVRAFADLTTPAMHAVWGKLNG